MEHRPGRRATCGSVAIDGDRVVVRTRDGGPLDDEVRIEAAPGIVRIRDGEGSVRLGPLRRAYPPLPGPRHRPAPDRGDHVADPERRRRGRRDRRRQPLGVDVRRPAGRGVGRTGPARDHVGRRHRGSLGRDHPGRRAPCPATSRSGRRGSTSSTPAPRAATSGSRPTWPPGSRHAISSVSGDVDVVDRQSGPPRGPDDRRRRAGRPGRMRPRVDEAAGRWSRATGPSR